jgi:hypothetical protein
MQADRSIPTLDDVAKAADVSTATVSRCLNLPERVAKTTLDRVLKAVKDLGYTPNFGARVMAARRTFTIGAIIPTMENAIFARGLQAFQEGEHFVVPPCGPVHLGNLEGPTDRAHVLLRIRETPAHAGDFIELLLQDEQLEHSTK